MLTFFSLYSLSFLQIVRLIQLEKREHNKTKKNITCSFKPRIEMKSGLNVWVNFHIKKNSFVRKFNLRQTVSSHFPHSLLLFCNSEKLSTEMKKNFMMKLIPKLKKSLHVMALIICRHSSNIISRSNFLRLTSDYVSVVVLQARQNLIRKPHRKVNKLSEP